MARPKPLCAKCGLSTKDKSRGGVVEIKYEAYPHMPAVAWHGDCLKKDKPMWKRVLGDATADQQMSRPGVREEVAKILAAIEKRGPGRVVRNKSALCRREYS